MKRDKRKTKIKIRLEVLEHETPFDLNSKVIKRHSVEGIEYHQGRVSSTESNIDDQFLNKS